MSSKFFHGSSLLVGDNTVPGVQLSKELKEYIPKILQACRNWGLDFYPTVVQLLNYDEISEVAAYGGFPVRFPHWSFGMEYEELQRGYEFGGHKIYEMVVNCLNFSVNVSSARGYIKVSDVKIGDILFSKNGGRRVVAVKKQAKSKVVKIDAFGYFQDTICTPNHKWQVLRGYKPEWVEAKDLVQGDILIAGGKYDNFLGSSPQIIWSKQKVYESTLPNVRWKLFDINPPKHMTVELAELLGICAGDGSSGVSGSENMIAIAVGKKNKQYQLHIQNIFHKVFNKEAAIYEKDSGDTVVLCSKYAVDYFNEIGMKKNVTFESKKVPSIIWESSNEYKAAFLRGIFDTDGHVKTSLQMCSKSFELIKDVQLLLLEIGIFSKVVHVNNKHNNIYVLYILGRSNQLAFSKYVNFSTEYKREALFNLVNSGYAIAHGNKLPNVQKEILRRLEELPNQRKLPAWIKRWKWLSNKKDVGCNTLWSFVSRLMSAGYDGFEDIFETLQSPMYVVEKCAEYGEEETIDIALDHDEHDFLANGLVSHNTNPCYIYNLASNTLADHLTVVAHATGHNDFFKNNIHFSATDTNMLNKMANHSARIRNYMSRWGKERVTEFLDHVMRLETLIDGSEAWTEKVVKDRNIRDERKYNKPQMLNVDRKRLYMEPFINTSSYRKKKNEEIHDRDIADEIGFFKEPTKNILGFIRDNAPLKPWQSDIVSMLYEEAIYFFPQRQTKVANEGWACGKRDTLVCSDLGILTLGEIVENRMAVTIYDGEQERKVTNWFTFENRDVYRIETRRGYVFEGSNNHRIMGHDDWIRMDAMSVGQSLKLSYSDIWSNELQEINYELPEKRIELDEIAEMASVTKYQVSYRKYHYKGEEKNDVLGNLIQEYDNQKTTFMRNKRNKISVPDYMTEDFASFVGYMIGDGHISLVKRTMGLTSGDKSQIDHYATLLKDLFGLECKIRWDGSSKNGRYRASVSSKDLELLLIHLGMKTGVCARSKNIPEIILKSPKNVVTAFIRSYFDCDGYAGNAGVILSTSSESMSRQIQNVLLNFKILSTRRKQKDSCWHIRITGSEAVKFEEQIGFGLQRKQDKLRKYVSDHKWFLEKNLEDEIVSVEKTGTDTVYDITVETSHRYSACGFINHNSTVDSVIMAEQGFIGLGQKSEDCGIVEYADHKMGVLGGKYSMNPYKLGFYLLADIRERWDKGRFGTEYDECTDMHKKENWDTGAMLGKEKIFEVRKYYDDLTMIHEFFTEEFCRKQEYFHWKHYPNGEYRIDTRDYKTIKKNLMQRHLNGGLPDIRLMEPNYLGRGIMLLQHYHDGRPLYESYLEDVLSSIRFLWNNDVVLVSKDENSKEKIYWQKANYFEVMDREKLNKQANV